MPATPPLGGVMPSSGLCKYTHIDKHMEGDRDREIDRNRERHAHAISKKKKNLNREEILF